MPPDPSLYPGLDFIGPIPMINRGWCFVVDWKKLSPAALERVKAEIDYVEDSCFDKGKL